ncbi:MAG: T9SS type A sorting domain-containing protein [Bacteroidetes bacterium]|nr:T9SS type A sorting domain-containing protein [Bacteroidota bacterium]
MKKLLMFLSFIILVSYSNAQITQPVSPIFNYKPASISTTDYQEWLAPDNLQASFNTLPEKIKNAQKAKSLIALRDSIYTWRLDILNNEWIPERKTINIVYDAHNNETSEMEQQWQWEDWSNSVLRTFSYDANNNSTNYLHKVWNNNAWENAYQASLIYNINNKRTSVLWQSWNSNSWYNDRQYTFSYDSNNNIVSSALQYWNNNIWENSLIYTNTYDVNNNNTSVMLQTWNDSTAWVNTSFDTLIYDANNNETSEINYIWDGNAWVNFLKRIYTYNFNNNLTNILSYSWNNNVWDTSSQANYTYDSQNNLISSQYQTWHAGNWVNYALQSRTIDENNFTKDLSFLEWESTGTKIIRGYRTSYYFHKVMGIYNYSSLLNKSVYPNPATDLLTIETPFKSTIEIINIQGQTILKQQLQQGKTELDVSELAKGIYILRMNSNNKTELIKIVKE